MDEYSILIIQLEPRAGNDQDQQVRFEKCCFDADLFKSCCVLQAAWLEGANNTDNNLIVDISRYDEQLHPKVVQSIGVWLHMKLSVCK